MCLNIILRLRRTLLLNISLTMGNQEDLSAVLMCQFLRDRALQLRVETLHCTSFEMESSAPMNIIWRQCR